MNSFKHLPKLMTFTAVAQSGSFTLAAKQLSVTKSAISQQVNQLEQDLGVRLLNRTTRGVSPTSIGERLLKRCLSLQSQANLIFDDLRLAGEDPVGRFSITLPHALASNVALPALDQLCTEYSGIEPETIVTDETLDLVKHQLDFAIHAGDLPDSNYRALPVGTMTEIFCATPLFLNRYGTPKNLDDLAKLKWISTSWQNTKTKVSFKNTPRNVNLTPFGKTNTLPTALQMALNHMGMILIPDIAAKPLLKNGQLVRIMDDLTGPLWPVHSLHPYTKEKPIHITRYHQLICQMFNDGQGH